MPAFVLGAAFTAIFAKYAPKGADWLPGTIPMHLGGVALSCAGVTAAAMALDTATAIQTIGWFGTGVVIVMFSGPLASMKRVIETKNTESLPLAMTVATFINCTLWTTCVWCCACDVVRASLCVCVTLCAHRCVCVTLCAHRFACGVVRVAFVRMIACVWRCS
jgi:hypothetical protein